MDGSESLAKVGCSACERRKRKLQALKDKKKAKGQQVQAAAIGAVLAVTEVAGKVIHGEVEDGREGDSGTVDPPG